MPWQATLSGYVLPNVTNVEKSGQALVSEHLFEETSRPNVEYGGLNPTSYLIEGISTNQEYGSINSFLGTEIILEVPNPPDDSVWVDSDCIVKSINWDVAGNFGQQFFRYRIVLIEVGVEES